MVADGVINALNTLMSARVQDHDVDHSVLADGTPVYKIDRSNASATTLRAVMPYIAYKNFRGSKCLKCHGVDEGAVLGASSLNTLAQELVHTVAVFKLDGQN